LITVDTADIGAHTIPFALEAAEQLIERQIRRDIQYRWILRQNTGE
jgi:hypothetical protein